MRGSGLIGHIPEGSYALDTLKVFPSGILIHQGNLDTTSTLDTGPILGALKFVYPKPRRKTHKKCIKCHCRRPKAYFGQHSSSGDGLQSYCKFCKNALGKKRREGKPAHRLKHHMSTRITSQLGKLCPDNLTEDLETHLGYTMNSLVRHLREELHKDEGPNRKLQDALEEGYHVDHIKPLSSYIVIIEGQIDWQVFRACWAINNLKAIPASVNLSKGAKYEETDEKPF